MGRSVLLRPFRLPEYHAMGIEKTACIYRIRKAARQIYCENIAGWLELRRVYFIELLKLENGIPCADIFLRVFRG